MARRKPSQEEIDALIGPSVERIRDALKGRPGATDDATAKEGPCDDEFHVEVEPWPEAPGKEAYAGLAGDVVRRIDPETEADPVAVLAQFMAFFGNVVGRSAYRPVGPKRHYGNLFVCVVGRTSKARKGTALSWVEAIFAAVDSEWDKNRIQSGLSSGEGLINAVRDGVGPAEGVTDKRLLVVEEEFASPLRLAARDGNILSAVLRQAWDGGRLRTLTRNNPLRATDAHISVVVHVTREELLRCLSETDVANGFANRFLWVAARRSKLLPDGGEHPDLADLQCGIRDAADFAGKCGSMHRSSDARDLWHAVYPKLSAEVPGVLGMATTRGEAQVLRLSVLYALLDQCATVNSDHLKSALALWDYSRRSCVWIFGGGTGDADADALLAAIRAAGEGGLSGREVSAVFGRNKGKLELERLLAVLVNAGTVTSTEIQTGGRGRPTQKWKVV